MSGRARETVPRLARMQEHRSNSRERAAGTRVLALLSGEAGVGKTSLAVRLGCELSRRGHRTLLVDAEPGPAAAPVSPSARPQRSLRESVAGAAPLQDSTATGPGGLRLARGGSRVVEQLKAAFDVILLDTAPGVGRDVTDYVAMADEIVLVTTNNFAAAADASGVVTALNRDGLDKPVHAVVNRARSAEEAARVFAKLRGSAERFLGFDLNWLGWLPEDSSVDGAASRRTSLSEAFPGSTAARCLARLVSDLERKLEAPWPAGLAAED